VLDQVEISTAHLIYSSNKDVLMRNFSVEVQFLNLHKTIFVEASSIVEASNKVYVDKVRVIKSQKGQSYEDGMSDYVVLVDVDGDHVSMTVKCRNVYEGIYNVSSSVLDILSIEELPPPEVQTAP
jgi:hypothetical protein